MKLLKYLLPLLALPFFSSLSCGKDPTTDERPLIKLDEDFLSYVSFPKGSYWIYEETTTGKIDSAYIYGKREEIKIDFPNASYNMQHRIEMIVQNEVIRKDTFWGRVFPLYISEAGVLYTYEHVQNIGNSTVGWSILEKYSNISYDSAAGFLTNPQIIPHASIMAYNAEYENVIECFYENRLNMVPYRRIFYAKDVGVIKREYWDGTTWELVRYHHAQ